MNYFINRIVFYGVTRWGTIEHCFFVPFTSMFALRNLLGVQAYTGRAKKGSLAPVPRNPDAKL